MNFIEAVKQEYPEKQAFTRPELLSVSEKYSLKTQFVKFITNKENRIQRGLYKIDPNFKITDSLENEAVVEMKKTKPIVKNNKIPTILEQKVEHVNTMNLVPEKDPEFVPFGDFSLLKKIINSKAFFPVYISGESGNGKTKMVYEVCAQSKKELIRANITESTDEDDLIGGYRLVNGETVWQDGPVVEAMKRGAALLLDEINLASPKIMCLQPILEGNPIYIKKTNTIVYPVHGFNIVATANTKGKSSDDGRYIGSNTLNEALLDRFAINIEHEYPSRDVEIKILSNILESFDSKSQENVEYVTKLVDWAKTIRDTFEAGGIDEIITTRRLIHILRFFLIAGGNRMRAIRYCTSRFDSDTKKAFFSLYQKLDSTVEIDAENFATDGLSGLSLEEVPF
jgi:hypothetical protein